MLRDCAVALWMAAVVMGAVQACGCTIERVVLYETVNYPAPQPTP